ncbi:MAG: bacteriochlorophyll/chlorophyll a synthase, partial [Pseudomonadota bacterium]
VQLFLMRALLDDPRGRAPWFNATGTTLYVLGMLATAIAISDLGDM